MTSIKAHARILQENCLESGNTSAAFMKEKMNGQIDRLTQLIADLLDFTHLEVDKLKLSSEQYNINNIIHEITDEWQRTTDKTRELKLDNLLQYEGDRLRPGGSGQ